MLEPFKNWIIYRFSNRDIRILKVWNNRDNLDIKDPKEPPLEKNKEIYIERLNNYFESLLNTSTVIVVDSEFLLNGEQQGILKEFLNSGKEEMILRDRFNEKVILNKYKIQRGVAKNQNATFLLKKLIEQNLHIDKVE